MYTIKHFTNAKDVQGPQGDNDYKFLIAEEIETSATERAQKNREQAQKNREQAQRKQLEAELKKNKGVVKLIGWYIAFNTKLDRTPSALGQKIINEYNKYQK